MKKRRKPGVQKRIFNARLAAYGRFYAVLWAARIRFRDDAMNSKLPLADRQIALLRFDGASAAHDALLRYRYVTNRAWFGDDPPTNGKP